MPLPWLARPGHRAAPQLLISIADRVRILSVGLWDVGIMTVVSTKLTVLAVGAAVREARAAAGLSVAALAERSGVSRAMIAKIESERGAADGGAAGTGVWRSGHQPVGAGCLGGGW